MENGTWPGRALASNLVASLPTSPGEVASIFWSGALAGFCLEAAVHGTQALHSRYEQLRRGHPLSTLGVKWWAAALRTPARPRGPYQGAVGTLAAGTLWSGIFGSVYVPVRAAVDATLPPDQTGWGPAAAAAAGSIAASSVRVPLQVVKGRMQAHEFFCSLQAFELILRREGPAALYRGWARSVSKNAPFDAVLFLLYDIGKTRITELNRARGGGGGGGGAAAAACASGGSHGAPLAATACGQGSTGAASGAAWGAAGGASGDGTGPAVGGHAEAGLDSSGAHADAADGSSRYSSSASSGGEGSGEADGDGMYRTADAAVVGGLAGALTGLLTSPPELWRLRGQLMQQAEAAAATAALMAAAGGGGGGAGGGRVATAVALGASGTAAASAAGGTARRAMPPFASDGGGGGGAAAAAARLRAVVAAALRGSLRARVLWAALEGAVFFSALETLIPVCDRVFMPAAESQHQSAESATAGGGGGGGGGQDYSEAAGLLGGSSPLRHPAHPLHW
ncbi:hypothetical protein CHLRE_01g007450v5 [Chlamydomonas reinhardtii]|uniref:Mitochondrial carrier protein n=1 Tax=Chlamydomonas reinhardtii TaxID=3055 RepID=A0A2K3E563_CHLRE|nr:uncharacterized protein CHLRE_01g007450v5 [Chlamydomonas reinhardtii]PNW87929.1 hypothetical protein CHLRE_01g007450v5 [Chlamydomonas reinhardtii]